MTKKEELEAQGYKTYGNDDIQVFWNPKMCQHVGACVRGNGKVFDVGRRPWVDVSQASASEIADIIDLCPSKALQYELLNPISIVFEEVLDRAAAYDRGKLIGECEFEPSADKWIITHTGVREAYEGKGIARKLVLIVIEAARAAGVKISPVCSYARKMMAGKEEFKDVM